MGDGMIARQELINSTWEKGVIKPDLGSGIYTISQGDWKVTRRFEIFEAIDDKGRALMVKTPLLYFCPQIGAVDLGDHLANLIKEASYLYGLKHPNIVEYVDLSLSVVQNRVRPAIIMEKVPGDTIKKDLLESLTIDEKLELIETIAKPLDYIHSKGYVLRDLGPQSVVTTKDFKKAKLIDLELIGKAGVNENDDWVFRAGLAPKSIIEQKDWEIEDGLWSYTAFAYYILTDGKYPFGEWEDLTEFENSVCAPNNLKRIENIRTCDASTEKLNELMSTILNKRDHSLDSCGKIAKAIKGCLV